MGESKRVEAGGESKVTSHGVSFELHVPEDGLPIGDGLQAGALSTVGLICFQTLTSRSLVVQESSNLSQLEELLLTNLVDNLCPQIIPEFFS